MGVRQIGAASVSNSAGGMTWRWGRSLAAVLTGVLAASCQQQDEEPAVIVLAQVADVEIFGLDLRRAAEILGVNTTSSTLEDWRQQLQLLIDKRLLVLEARRLGLDSSREVQAAVDVSQRRGLTESLLKRSFGQLLNPDETAIRAYFDSTRAGVEIRVRRLVLRDRRRALKALQQIRSGVSLAQLDLDSADVVSDANLGWLSPLASTDPRLSRLFDRETGAVELIEAEGHYFLMEVTDRREAPFADRRDMVHRALMGERRSQANMRFLESLLAKYEVRLDTGAVQRLRAATDPAALDPTMRLVKSNLGDWTVGEYLGTAVRLPPQAREESSSALGFRLTRAYVVAQLLPREAQEAGIADSLARRRQSALERRAVEALWATEGFGPDSAVQEPERFDAYLEDLRQRYAERVHVDEDAFAAYVADQRRSAAPVDY